MKPPKQITLLTTAALCLLGMALTAQAQVPKILHRWSFNGNLSDSVGNNNGTMVDPGGFGTATATAYYTNGGTAIYLNNPSTASGGSGAYVDLGLFPELTTATNITWELWMQDDGARTWQRFFDFGNYGGHNMWLADPNGTPTLRATYDINNAGEQQINATATTTLHVMNHVVVTTDRAASRGVMYLNGVQVGVNTAFTLTPAAHGTTTNNWLGRSQYGDPALLGGFDEFRIWTNAMTPLQVALNFQAGPNVLPTTYTGTVTSIQFTFPVTTIVTNGVTQATVKATYNVGGNPVTLDVTTSVNYTSSAPATATVGRNTGLVTGVGTTTNTSVRIWAEFSGIYATNTLTTVPTSLASLTHRYSFASDATDSVGGAKGVPQGSAAFSGGQLVLDGSSSYLDLGAIQDLSSYDAITWEFWLTDQGTAQWGRIFDFGTQANAIAYGSMNLEPNGAAGTTTLLGEMKVNPGQNQTMTTTGAGRPAIGAKTHVVMTTDSLTRRGVIYLNGVQVGINTAWLYSPKDVGPTTNNWLGRSQYNTDPYFTGSYDEFRIWKNVLTPFQIALNLAAGPNNVPASDIGPATALHMTLPLTSSGVGARQQVALTADYSGGVSGVNITTLGFATFTSSNTNVASIDANGNVRALGVGTTTLTATSGAQTAQAVLTVIIKPIQLIHRYSFNEAAGSTTVADSVGGANGVFEPGFAGALGGGAASLDGAASYIQLPAGLITNRENVTIETWATVDSNSVYSGNVRLFTIGSTSGGNEIGLIPGTASPNALTRLRASTPAGNVTADIGGDLASIGPTHVVAVFDPNTSKIEMYINGKWINSQTTLNSALSSIIDREGDIGANIGHSAFLAGSFDEFRIWQGAFSRAAVAASYAAGPNVIVNPIVSGTAPTVVTLRVDPTMVVTSRQLPHILTTFPNATPADLGGFQDTNIVYTTSDPTVVRVNTTSNRVNGVWTNTTFEAVGVGTATVTASVDGVTSAAQTISVVPKQTMLVHEWKFNEPASAAGTAMGKTVKDSVGVQDGWIWGTGTSLTGTQVSFDPGTGNDKNSYVELPASLISSYDAVTLDAWFTSGASGQWNRIYDIGTYSAAGSGLNYLYGTTRNGGTPQVGQFDGSDGTEVNVGLAINLETNSFHITVVYDKPGAGQIIVYTNGQRAASSNIGTARQIPRGIQDVRAFIAKSEYDGDQAWVGSMDEFRIYSGALTAAQVASSQSAGANGLVSFPPSLSMQTSGNSLVFKWQTASGYSLKSSTSLQPNSGYTTVSGTPTTQGSLSVLTVPAPAATTFYLLGNP